MQKKTVKKAPAYKKLWLGIILLISGLLLISGKIAPEVKYAESFESEPVEVSGFSAQDIDEAKIPNKIVIPSVSIDLAVKSSPLVDGYWQVFEDSAGWGEGSGLPGEKGNQVIFAHARQGLFSDLKKTSVGDSVYVFTGKGYYEYVVSGIKEVYPGQVEVIAPSDDETLTLYTCSGYADSKRLIVIAKPRK